MALQLQIIARLQVEPAPLGRAGKPRQPQRGVGRHGAGAVDDFIGASGWHTETVGQAILGQPQRQEKLLQEDLAGMHGGQTPLSGSRRFRHRTHLIIDTDAVLAGPATRELLQPIGWGARGGRPGGWRRPASATCADRCAVMPRPICGPVPAARHGRSTWIFQRANVFTGRSAPPPPATVSTVLSSYSSTALRGSPMVYPASGSQRESLSGRSRDPSWYVYILRQL